MESNAIAVDCVTQNESGVKSVKKAKVNVRNNCSSIILPESVGPNSSLPKNKSTVYKTKTTNEIKIPYVERLRSHKKNVSPCNKVGLNNGSKAIKSRTCAQNIKGNATKSTYVKKFGPHQIFETACVKVRSWSGLTSRKMDKSCSGLTTSQKAKSVGSMTYCQKERSCTGIITRKKVRSWKGSDTKESASCNNNSKKKIKTAQVKLLRSRRQIVKKDSNCQIAAIRTRIVKRDSSAIILRPQQAFHIDIAKDKKFSCLHCNKAFKNNVLLQYHIKQSHKYGDIMCSKCGANFSKQSALQQHVAASKRYINKSLGINEKEAITKLSCLYCKKNFCTISSVKYHIMLEHTVNGQYPCSICGLKFSGLSSIEEHWDVHKKRVEQSVNKRSANAANICCLYCGKLLKKTAENHHIRRKHTFQGLYPCIACDMKFERLCQIKKHLAVHDFSVAKGVKGFVQLDNIPTESSSDEHEGNKRLCPSKEIETVQELKLLCDRLKLLHLDKNLNEPNCIQSKLSHQSSSALNMQCKLSLQSVPYLNFQLNSKNELNQHKVLHKQKWSCYICCESYSARDALAKHIRKVHLTCSVCGDTVALYHLMLEHMNTHK